MKENEIKHEGPTLDSANGFDVIECGPCGFKHVIPIPSAKDLEEVYRHEYYTKEKPLYLERHREDLEWWNLVYGERYDFFEQHLPPDRRQILDIGSGPGFFLLHGKNRGWETMGIEPSAHAAAHSRGLGLQITEDFLTDSSAKTLGQFDAIHASEVLEHIADPAGLLGVVHSLLKPGGLLCVVVPNDYNPFQHVLRSACGYKPWWVAPPHHINYFNVDSLGRLFARNNFSIVHQEATFPIDLFLLMGDNYIGNDALGRQCHAKRKTFEKNLAATGRGDLKRNLYQHLASVGLGREIVLFASKP